MTQQLYRLFNAADELLYIGISMSAISRAAQHKATQPWWQDVARVDIETHEVDRETIKQMEREAIRAELPKHNKQHAQTLKVGWHMARPENLRLGEYCAIGLDGRPICVIGRVVGTASSHPDLLFEGELMMRVYDEKARTLGSRNYVFGIAEVYAAARSECMETLFGFRKAYLRFFYGEYRNEAS